MPWSTPAGTRLNGALRAIFPPRCALPLVGVATIGSAGRDTMIRPLDEVDVFAVFSAAGGAWKRFRWTRETCCCACARNAIGAGHGADHRVPLLRVVYDSPPDVHLVPAFDHPRAGYVIPDRIGGWSTRPERHASWMVDAGPRVVSAVRLLKVWNRVCGSHLRSFHLEALAGKVLRGRGLNTRQGLAETSDTWTRLASRSAIRPTSAATFPPIFSPTTTPRSANRSGWRGRTRPRPSMPSRLARTRRR